MAYVNFGRKNTREEALASTNKDKVFFPTDATSIIFNGKEYGVGGNGVKVYNLLDYTNGEELEGPCEFYIEKDGVKLYSSGHAEYQANESVILRVDCFPFLENIGEDTTSINPEDDVLGIIYTVCQYNASKGTYVYLGYIVPAAMVFVDAEGQEQDRVLGSLVPDFLNTIRWVLDPALKLRKHIGQLDQLETENKTSLVAAINELKAMIDNLTGGAKPYYDEPTTSLIYKEGTSGVSVENHELIV